MRRSIVFAALLMLVLVVPAAAQAAPPERFESEGGNAMATWFDEDGETFTFTSAFLNVGTFSFAGTEEDEAFFDITLGEFSPDGTSSFLFGFAELTPDQYTLDTAGRAYSASVEDVEVVLEGEECSGEPTTCTPVDPLTVTVSIDWAEASGRVYPSVFAGRSHTPSFFDSFLSRSLARFTTATGEMSGDLDRALGESDEASVAKEASTSRFRFVAM